MTRPSAAALVVTACVLVAVASVPLPVAAHANHVAADPQTTPDGTLVVESAFILDDGFVAVQRDDGGEPGAVLGHTALSGRDGFVTDVEVAIDDGAWADWNGPERVHLVLRNDDGDGTFDPDDDRIVRSFGSAAAAVTTVDRGERAVVTARGFSPQTVANDSVTVRRAVLPTDGRLVLENATDGRRLGSVALDAGSHANVTVPLDAELGAADRHRVRAVLHDGDAPVTVGDEPVATAFSVRGGSSGSGTATPTPDLVTTATPFPDESATPTATTTAEPTASGGQPGFGVLAVATAVALLAVVAVARAWAT